jgi:hypothetical protein
MLIDIRKKRLGGEESGVVKTKLVNIKNTVDLM